MIFFKSTNTHAPTMKIESQEMKSFTSLQEVKSFYNNFSSRTTPTSSPPARATDRGRRPTDGATSRRVRDDDRTHGHLRRRLLRARATRGRNERDDSDERVVALRVLVQVSRGDRGNWGARATTERDDGARDDDEQASTTER